MSTDIQRLLARVRKLEIRAKQLVQQSFAGEYRSSFKGQGLDFEDFRPYQAGDEPRFIDWNVTARTGIPHIRQFREERELNLVFAVDVSPSMRYGSKHLSKAQLATELTALLAFSAIRNGDRVGLVLFSEEPLLFVRPEKGQRHGLRLLRELLVAQDEEAHPTELGSLTEFLLRTLKRKSLVILISDFMTEGAEASLGTLARKHELVALHLCDPAEKELPAAGRLTLRDPETGWLTDVNTDNPNLRMAFEKLSRRQHEGLHQVFARHRIDFAEISTHGDYLPTLHRLLKSRIHRQHP